MLVLVETPQPSGHGGEMGGNSVPGSLSLAKARGTSIVHLLLNISTWLRSAGDNYFREEVKQVNNLEMGGVP